MRGKKELNENNKLKEQICIDCKVQLKGVLSQKQLEEFEEIFYTVTEGYIFKEIARKTC